MHRVLMRAEDVAKVLRIEQLSPAELEKRVAPALILHVGGVRHPMWDAEEITAKFVDDADG